MSTLAKFTQAPHEVAYHNAAYTNPAYFGIKDSFESDYDYNNGPYIGLTNGMNSGSPSSISSITSSSSESNTSTNNNNSKSNSSNNINSTGTNINDANNNKNNLLEEKHNDTDQRKHNEDIINHHNNDSENVVQYTNMTKREDNYYNDGSVQINLQETISRMQHQQQQQQRMPDFSQLNYYQIAQDNQINRRNTYQHNIDPGLQPLQSASVSSILSPNSINISNTSLPSVSNDVCQDNSTYLKGYQNVLYPDQTEFPNLMEGNGKLLLTQLTGNREQIYQQNMMNYIPGQFAKIINIHDRNTTYEVANHKDDFNEISKNETTNINHHVHHHHNHGHNQVASNQLDTNKDNNDSNVHNVHSSSTRTHSKSNGHSNNNLPLNDYDLIHLPLRELNKRLRNLSKPQASELKRRRRTLKNRKYAQNCRSKRLDQKTEMEEQNKKLKNELISLRRLVEKLTADKPNHQEGLFKEHSSDSLKLYSKSNDRNDSQMLFQLNQHTPLNNRSMITQLGVNQSTMNN